MLDIVIACRNETDNLIRTLNGLYRSTRNIEYVHRVIVVDDFSDPPIEVGMQLVDRVIRSARRMGVGGCRDLGASLVDKGDAFDPSWIMFTDAHMQFPDGWVDKVMRVLMGAKHDQLFTGSYVYCEMWDQPRPIAIYGGGVYHHFLSDPAGAYLIDTFVNLALTNDTKPYEVPIISGAAYFIRKDWYDHIRGISGTLGWGHDEQLLSRKTWLAGGQVMVIPDLQIRHIYEKQRKKAASGMSGTPPYMIAYNAIHSLRCTMPNRRVRELLDVLPIDDTLTRGLQLYELMMPMNRELYEYLDNARIHEDDWFMDKWHQPRLEEVIDSILLNQVMRGKMPEVKERV